MWIWLRYAEFLDFVFGGMPHNVRSIVLMKQIVNFDAPKTIEEYIHQVGRAGTSDLFCIESTWSGWQIRVTKLTEQMVIGRVANEGVAFTFLNKSNANLFAPLGQLVNSCYGVLPPQMKPYLAYATEDIQHGKKRKSYWVQNNDEGWNQ